MTLHILEKLQIVSGFVPVNLATAANTGDYVNLAGYCRCAVVFFKGAGTAGDDPVLTLTQAQDVSGTGVKALNFDRIDTKQGTLTAVGTFTTVVNADADYTDDTSAEIQAIWVIDVPADTLDVANKFTCLKAVVGDVGSNSQIGGLLYLLHDPRHVTKPLPSAIV